MVGPRAKGNVAATEAPIVSLACEPNSHAMAVGTELHNHAASILLWYVPLQLLWQLLAFLLDT